MYKFESRVRYSEVSCDGVLTLEALLNYFQDVSTFQSEDLGVGLEYLAGFHMAWVLSSWQIQVNRYPKLGEKIVAATFPYEFKGFFGMRNFLLLTEDEEVLACANTMWTLLDMEKMVPAKPTAEMLEKYVLEEKYPMDYQGRKISIPGNGLVQSALPVSPDYLDTNFHVNNGQYVRIAKRYLPDRATVKQLRAEYRKSAVLGDVFYPVVYENDGIWVVSLNDQDGKAYAVVEFAFV